MTNHQIGLFFDDCNLHQVIVHGNHISWNKAEGIKSKVEGQENVLGRYLFRDLLGDCAFPSLKNAGTSFSSTRGTPHLR